MGNILKRHGLPPAPERQKTTTWKEFIRSHLDVLVATDFFTTEVWTRCGFPSGQPANDRERPIKCRERLGGMLKFYDRKAA